MKSNIEQTREIIERANVKEVKELFNVNDYSVYSENAEIIAELVSKNSNDFTKDIASRIVEKEGTFNTSAKQAWCLAYQVINNLEVYKTALNEYETICKNA